jgi:hypothetical protein
MAGDTATERAPAEERRWCGGMTVLGGTARVTGGPDHGTDRGGGRRPPAETTGMVAHRVAVKRAGCVGAWVVQRRAASGPRTIDSAMDGSGDGEAARWLVLARPVVLDGAVGESWRARLRARGLRRAGGEEGR